MKDTKAVELLATLDKNELKELGKFIVSPFFSRGRDLVPLYNELKKFHPGFDDPSLTREFIYKRLYPGKTFGDPKSNNLLKTLTSELFILSKRFLAQMEFESDKKQKGLYTLKQLRKRKQFKEFEKEYALTDKDIEDLEAIGMENILELYYNSAEYTAYSIETGSVQNVFDSLLRGSEFSLLHGILKSYMNPDMKLSTAAFNVRYKENFSDIVIDNLDSDKMISDMRQSGHKFLPYMEVFHTVFLMSKFTENTEHYFKLKSLLEKHIELFVHSQKYILYAMLGSYCARKSTFENSDEFVREGFGINDRVLELGIYKYSLAEDFQVNLFRNMVLTAMDLNESAWLEKFINKYSDELNAEHRENMKLYSLAHLYFIRQEFEKALEHLIKVKYNFFLFKMDVRYLMFRIYYELGHDEQAYSALSSIAQFLKETKDLSESFKKRGSRFVTFSRELVRRKTENNTKDIELFKKKVLASQDVNSRGWLLEKIDELIIN